MTQRQFRIGQVAGLQAALDAAGAPATMYNPQESAPTGLYSWHHSEAGITHDGAGTPRVTVWADQSGNSRNFAGAASLGPIVETTQLRGGLTGLRDGRLTSSIIPATGAGARTVIIVTGNWRFPGGVYNHLYSYGSQATGQMYSLVNIENSVQRIGGHYWTNLYLNGPHWGSNHPMVIAQRYNGTQDEIIVNGFSSGLVATTLNTGSGEGMNLHTRIANLEGAQATTFCLITWSRALTNAELEEAFDALGAYYSVPGFVEGPTGDTPWGAVEAWAMTTVYSAAAPASVVTYQGETYVCSTSHTSTSSFDASKWLKIAAKGADGNDTGANHVVGSGVNTITVGTSFPSSPTVGDIFIQRS